MSVAVSAPSTRRTIRLQGLPRLSGTSSCDVYQLDGGHVLRLFDRSVPFADIESEARISSVLHRHGAPVPQVELNIVRADDGRYGLVFEKIEGLTFAQLYARKPWNLVRITSRLAEIHQLVHRISPPEGLPSQREQIRERLARAGSIAFRERQQLLALLKTLPDSRSLCHGNFHVGNVMISDAGDPVILSWSNANIGDPMCDAARTAVILGPSRSETGGLRSRMRSIYASLLAKKYIGAYLHPDKGGFDRFALWSAINAAARLEEEIVPEHRNRLIRLVRSVLGRH
jgi:aminoglycoside phosphotransferase (APT) family kinase protein